MGSIVLAPAVPGGFPAPGPGTCPARSPLAVEGPESARTPPSSAKAIMGEIPVFLRASCRPVPVWR